ncbi:xanthine dehydrogenase family protein subunit M [Aliihoeflea aestuarii]|jgi:xanthine dehydrogenase YagS FAD-binding subunit|uniref:FAD binding domain-containing protein n=1 Tax=Aliihoeflea aestuarii TaxID=453840 RepID=UPI002092A84C|nr:xanthine dehydrogenase family protein subunit M [Aliihoeflea aestuarii]MCO6391172.1 xanthine dehydrogenase family protein subunit M [Aliihoeflea aestuarii]
MKPFNYSRAADDKAAVTSARGQGARYLGGGTNLIDLMKHEIEQPDALVDVSRLPHEAIEETGDGVRIGAAVTNSALAGDPIIRERYPLLSTALLSGATMQLRNRATTGGNFLQRTRCQYFYDTQRACNKREPGSGCDAVGGLNRFHAILGASEQCIAVHPSDMAVAMVALGAHVETALGEGSGRTLPADALHRLPGDTPHIDHQLRHGELITHVVLPKAAEHQLYRKVRDRSSYAFAVVSIGVAFDLLEGNFMNVRIALGGVAHKPWRAARAEEILEGKAPSPELFAKAADAELAEARGYGHNDFKIPLMRRLIIASFGEMTAKQENAA